MNFVSNAKSLKWPHLISPSHNTNDYVNYDPRMSARGKYLPAGAVVFGLSLVRRLVPKPGMSTKLVLVRRVLGDGDIPEADADPTFNPAARSKSTFTVTVRHLSRGRAREFATRMLASEPTRRLWTQQHMFNHVGHFTSFVNNLQGRLSPSVLAEEAPKLPTAMTFVCFEWSDGVLTMLPFEHLSAAPLRYLELLFRFDTPGRHDIDYYAFKKSTSPASSKATSCPANKVLNVASNRCVLRSGALGRAIASRSSHRTQ